MTEPTGNTVTFAITPIQITDIKFQHGDNMLVYEPRGDITPMDVANLLQLFTVATLQSSNTGWNTYDYPEFIERKGLMRHFRKETK